MGGPPQPRLGAGEDDWWEVRQFLIDLYPTTPLGFLWEIRRWDGLRFHGGGLVPCRLWEAESGELIGAVHPENGGDAHLQVHPDHRDLEPAMIRWAERHLAATGPCGVRTLAITVGDEDTVRRGTLLPRGYRPVGPGSVTRRLVFGPGAVHVAPLAAPYRMRTTRATAADCARMTELLNAAFGRTSHTPAEYAGFVAESPSFRHDLNLVAEAPDGSFAAHAGFTYDAANRRAILEPVCTHPAHRRRGLARALIRSGLERVRRLGAEVAVVDSGPGDDLDRLYREAGFTEAHRSTVFRRSW